MLGSSTSSSRSTTMPTSAATPASSNTGRVRLIHEAAFASAYSTNDPDDLAAVARVNALVPLLLYFSPLGTALNSNVNSANFTAAYNAAYAAAAAVSDNVSSPDFTKVFNDHFASSTFLDLLQKCFDIDESGFPCLDFNKYKERGLNATIKYSLQYINNDVLYLLTCLDLQQDVVVTYDPTKRKVYFCPYPGRPRFTNKLESFMAVVNAAVTSCYSPHCLLSKQVSNLDDLIAALAARVQEEKLVSSVLSIANLLLEKCRKSKERVIGAAAVSSTTTSSSSSNSNAGVTTRASSPSSIVTGSTGGTRKRTISAAESAADPLMSLATAAASANANDDLLSSPKKKPRINAPVPSAAPSVAAAAIIIPAARTANSGAMSDARLQISISSSSSSSNSSVSNMGDSATPRITTPSHLIDLKPATPQQIAEAMRNAALTSAAITTTTAATTSSSSSSTLTRTISTSSTTAPAAAASSTTTTSSSLSSNSSESNMGNSAATSQTEREEIAVQLSAALLPGILRPRRKKRTPPVLLQTESDKSKF